MIQKETEKKFQEYYKRYIEKDMLDFYREMESYGLLLQNRLESFKNNIKLQQKQLLKWEEIYEFLKKTKKGKEISEFIEHRHNDLLKMMDRLEALEKEFYNPSRQFITKSSPEGTPQNSNKTDLLKNKRIIQKTKEEKNPEVFKDKPTHTKIDPKIEYEDINIAEEILKESADMEPDPIDRQIDIARTLKNQNLEKDTKKDKSNKNTNSLIQFAENLGKTLKPVLGFKNNEIDYQKNTYYSYTNAPLSKSFPSEFEKKLNIQKEKPKNQNPYIEKSIIPLKKPVEANMNTNSAKNHQEIAKINPEELSLLIQRMQNPGNERLEAMRRLMSYRFTLQDISDFSGVSLSELETTRNIYHL